MLEDDTLFLVQTMPMKIKLQPATLYNQQDRNPQQTLTGKSAKSCVE